MTQDTPNPKHRVEAPVHEHVYDEHWYPSDRTHVRRVCVMPGCTETQVKEVLG